MQTFNYDHHLSSSESEEDYIDMEVQQDSPYAAVFGHSNEEFEFQSFSSSSEKDRQVTTTTNTSTSPADELFYMGKLLPLHLPHRLEMVQKIFQHTYSINFNTKTEDIEESFKTPLKSTPFESCNASPSHSCQVSAEQNPRFEYFLDCSTSSIKEKKSWTKKLMKWPNLKSLFTKSAAGCEYDSKNQAANQGPAPDAHKRADYKPFGQIKYNKGPKEDCRGSNRSFSGAFKMESKSKKSTSDTSLNSNVQIPKRSSTIMSSELENPIQAAIAHCKRSLDQQQHYLILFKQGY